ncbi:FGGY carbohydrate kinase domain-containing protein [Rhodnius prolixus]|uniref:FGGY carbohydrate kinase domain-containing protein n=1 Tax=Rhodnius prolixus TaxID=13249 RepID=UPI003D18DF32
MEDELFIGIDVGTGSVRGCLVNKNGHILKTCVKEIKTYNPQPDFYQQSSEEIWDACCFVVKKVTSDVDANKVKGIGFDATCSLVAIDKNGKAVSISPTGENDLNIILWLDHRASKEADFINSTNHPCLKQVGGQISLEMEIPKLLWLKNNLNKQCWEKADKFFDLPDFLTWKATGCDSRSLCSVVCKWLYEASTKGAGWNQDFLNIVGLEDLTQNNYYKIGNTIKAPGEPCGNGLSKISAQELNLIPGTAVGTSIIDAHAGGLGLLGCKVLGITSSFSTRLSMICGTSTCHMAVNEEEIFVKGIWGPYFSAMVPGMWLNEAGQSATGILVDHIINSHPATEGIKHKIGQSIMIVQYLNNLLEKLALKDSVKVDTLTKDIHMVPDFHGNRSPLADHSLRGMITGLDLNSGEEQLAIVYLATLQALAYGAKHIIEVLQEGGYKNFECILICGGLSKNELFVKTLANVASIAVLVPNNPESVLLGSAMLGATAAKSFPDLRETVLNMAGGAIVVQPTPNIIQYHEKKYLVFKKMLSDQKAYRKLMAVNPKEVYEN